MPFVGLELRGCAEFAGALDREGPGFNRLLGRGQTLNPG
jgi:hypothetical protein